MPPLSFNTAGLFDRGPEYDTRPGYIASQVGLPTIDLKIRHMGQEIASCFTAQSLELKPFIERALTALLSPENIQKEIDDLVKQCVKESIVKAFNSPEVKAKLEEIILKDIIGRLNTSTIVHDLDSALTDLGG